MRITGSGDLVFGVDDVAGAARYLTDYGLTPVNASETGGRFEAIDGTGRRHRASGRSAIAAAALRRAAACARP